MKRLLFILFFVLSMMTQAQSPCYSYKIKLKGIENKETAKAPSDYLKILFRAEPLFNDSSKQFEIKTNVAIVENGFTYFIQEEGYIKIMFDRKECNKEEGAKK